MASRIKVEHIVLVSPSNSPYSSFDTRISIHAADNTIAIVGDISYTDLSAAIKKANKIVRPRLNSDERRTRERGSIDNNY
jgi:hypothetical protein